MTGRSRRLFAKCNHSSDSSTYMVITSQTRQLMSPLYDLTASKKGDDPVQLSAENIKSFKEIKSRLCAGPRLAHPDLERPFVLYTDASKIPVGAVLLQSDSDDIERAVSFFSKKLSPTQRRNYSTFERECLAIICALVHFCVYLLGRRFRLRTDHRALAWLFLKDQRAFSAGWLL